MSAKTLQDSKQKKRLLRRKRRIIAYTTRFLVSAALILMAVLMVFGCLYIHDLIHGNPVRSQAAQLSGSGDAEQENSKNQMPISADYSGCTVVLDAGHGGKDVGTMPDEKRSDIYEKDINLSMTLQLKELLEACGVKVVLTRNDDTFLELKERTDLSNQENPDLFVSLHCNYFEDDSSIRGLECYYAPNSDKGMASAETILNVLTENGNVVTRNAKSADYYVLKHTAAPAVLVEMGYLSNQSDLKNLTSEQYQQLLSQELAEGILSALSNLEKKTTVSDN